MTTTARRPTRRPTSRKTKTPETPTANGKRFFTVQTCAAITNESAWTWRERAYRGDVSSVKIGGRRQARLLIPESEVVRLIDAGLRPAGRQ